VAVGSHFADGAAGCSVRDVHLYYRVAHLAAGKSQRPVSLCKPYTKNYYNYNYYNL
jgi:hypothetical protein